MRLCRYTTDLREYMKRPVVKMLIEHYQLFVNIASAWEKFNATATAAGTNVDEFDDSYLNSTINILEEIAERYYVHKML